MVRRYLLNVLIAIDQGINALLGGDPDETLSSRMGKHKRGPARWLCKLLSLIDGRHCEKSIEADEGKDAVAK